FESLCEVEQERSPRRRGHRRGDHTAHDVLCGTEDDRPSRRSGGHDYQMRGLCLEYGVALREGAGVFKIDLPKAVADEANDPTPRMRQLLGELFEDLLALEQRVLELAG